MAAPTAAEQPNLDLDKTTSPYKIEEHLFDHPEKQQPPLTSSDQHHDSKDDPKTDRPLDHSNRASMSDTDLDIEKAGGAAGADRQGQEEAASQTESQEEEPEYPSNKKLIPIIGSLYFSFFLVALDRTILATAIPRITDEFNSLGDVGWYGSAYMLCMCAFQLLFGKIYTFYNPKTVYLLAITVFEIGSVICGAAPTSTAFIIGRAVAGLGASGLFSGAIIIIINTVPLHKRPLYQGLIGAIFGVASVAGPLLGGLFTTKVTWRWCFYINLPIGGLAMAVLFLILKIPSPKYAKLPLRQQFINLDPLGTAVFLPAVVCLLLALQWGGTTYAWSNARIIVLLILFALLISAFLLIQHIRKEKATVPLRIVRQRSIAAGMWNQFCSGSAMMIFVYYLPIWFQAIKDVSAVHSGIMNLPLILSLVVAGIMGGIAVNRLGYYTPFMIISTVLTAIAAGLITTFTPTTPHQKWIAYQFLFGYGLGLAMQQGSLAAQTCLPKKDAPIGVSLIMFMMQLGGAIFVSVGQNVFTNSLAQGLSGIDGLDPQTVVNTGATELRRAVPPKLLPMVLEAYNGALVKCFRVALTMACLGILGSGCMEWKSVRREKDLADREKREKAEKEKAAAEVATESKT